MRSDTNTGMRRRTSFVIIGCEMTGQYGSRKKDFVRRDIGSMKCGCPFKLHGKPVVGGCSFSHMVPFSTIFNKYIQGK